MQIKRQFTVNTSAETVWEIIGHHFDRMADWASGAYASQAKTSDNVLPNAPYSGWVSETVLGRLDETITQYDEDKRIVAYTVKTDKMPFFVKQLSNHWTVTPLSDNQCRVDMCMRGSLLPVFNLIIAPMMRMLLSAVFGKTIEELKYFAEKGVPHPRKLEAQQKSHLKTA